MPHLEITEVVLVHSNIASNDYQHDSRILYTFAPNKSFGLLLDNSPKRFMFVKGLTQSFHVLKYGLMITNLNR